MLGDSLSGEHNLTMAIEKSVYRLVGMDGLPHPVLDTLYESIDAAVIAARDWNSRSSPESGFKEANKKTIGIEVLTINGSWRTILYS